MYRLGYKLRGRGLGRIPGVQQLYKLCLPKEEKLEKIKLLDFEMLVDLRDIGDLTSSLVTRGTYDSLMTDVIKHHVREGTRCVDIGANIGYFTLILSKKVKETGVILAYEPEKRNYNLLTRNLELNQVTNVFPTLGAVGAKPEHRILHTSKSYFGSHSLREGVSKGKKDVELVKVDTLDNQVGTKVIDFIKVDVQGAEYEVLQGMQAILKINPNITMVWEYLPDGLKRFDCTPFTFLGALQNGGFKFWDIDEKLNRVVGVDIPTLISKYNKKGSYTNLLVRR